MCLIHVRTADENVSGYAAVYDVNAYLLPVYNIFMRDDGTGVSNIIIRKTTVLDVYVDNSIMHDIIRVTRVSTEIHQRGRTSPDLNE